MVTPTKLHIELDNALQRRRRIGSLRELRTRDACLQTSDFSSNDYLDLSSSSALKDSFRRHLSEATSMAATGSRLLSGNNDLADTIETEAKAFWHSADALLCSSGYEANVALFSTLPQPKDTIIYDELIHASAHVGMKASRAARKVKMRHNDIPHLRQLLRQESLDHTRGNTFVALETVYSMDGDVAPLMDILEVIRSERPSTLLILDEAHATGVFGESGRGLAHHLHVDDAPEILARLHTLGKGAAGTGAIILCDPLVKQYLLNYAKGLIYSTFMSIPALCLARASIDLLSSGANRAATDRLWHNMRYFQKLLTRLSSTTMLELPRCIESPIVPIITPKAVELSAFLERHGFRVMPVRYPTVPRGRERLRICLRADIEKETMNQLVTAIQQWLSQHGSASSSKHELPMTAKI